MVEVILDADAAAFIRAKGGHLILFLARVTGCCGIGSAPEAMWEVGHPRRPPEEYRSIEQDGITVHIDQLLDTADERFHISLTSLFGWKSLSLSHKGGLES